MNFTRRHALAIPVASAGGLLLARVAAAQPQPAATYTTDSFPAQDPNLVREIVGASHGNQARVEALLKESPRLANATYDWGFGDWETCLGAAAHTGRKAIAALLLEAGARPDIFAFAMLGNLEAVKAIIAAHPGIERVRGPHGITLAAHARAGGEDAAKVAEFLKTLSGADVPYKDEALTDAQRTACLGEYSFGPGDTQRFKVLIPDKASHLVIQRAAGAPRRLFHQGDLAFHPAGSPETRITFTVADDRAVSVAVTTPAPLVVGQRVG